MSVGRFRTDGGTHRVLFEKKTSGEDLDCAIAVRRPKLARNDILFAAFGERPKSDPGARKTRQSEAQRVDFCKRPQTKMRVVSLDSSLRIIKLSCLDHRHPGSLEEVVDR